MTEPDIAGALERLLASDLPAGWTPLPPAPDALADLEAVDSDRYRWGT